MDRQWIGKEYSWDVQGMHKGQKGPGDRNVAGGPYDHNDTLDVPERARGQKGDRKGWSAKVPRALNGSPCPLCCHSVSQFAHGRPLREESG